MFSRIKKIGWNVLFKWAVKRARKFITVYKERIDTSEERRDYAERLYSDQKDQIVNALEYLLYLIYKGADKWDGPE